MVAIIGRKNVGKSTLFNRLVGRRKAIVEDFAGTTRDRLYEWVEYKDRRFLVVDTGGLEAGADDPLEEKVIEQAKLAVEEAGVLLFVVDVRSGLLPQDKDAAEILRKSGKPVVLVANKAESGACLADVAEFFKLGLGEPVPISAYHDRGIDELLDRILPLLPEEYDSRPAEVPKLAIIGRPNVGKSSLLNTILGYERAIVDETPGTTRDSLDTLVDFKGRSVLILDTAGLRRRGRVERGIEKWSALRALMAIEESDVSLLVLDGQELVTAQDQHIAGEVKEKGKGLVLVVNKWDLAQTEKKDVSGYLRKSFQFFPGVPIIFTSAKTGYGVKKIIPTALTVYEERMKRVPTAELNRVLEQARGRYSSSFAKGKELKFFYATQVEVSPPSFVFFVNDPEIVHFSYERYLENRLREAFGFNGIPIKMIFRSRA